MMNGNAMKWMTGLTILLCLLTTGCSFSSESSAKPTVWMEKSTRSKLLVPADFTIKIIGDTTYTYKDTTIPVAQIIREELEKRIQKIPRFSLDKGTGNQYLIGINLIKYEPRIDPEKKKMQLFQYPQLWYEVLICEIKTDDKGEKVIGERLATLLMDMPAKERSGGMSMDTLINPFDIVHGAFTYKDAWRTVLEHAAKRITLVLDTIFQK